MTPEEHYRKAEELLVAAESLVGHADQAVRSEISGILPLVQAHAALAGQGLYYARQQSYSERLQDLATQVTKLVDYSVQLRRERNEARGEVGSLKLELDALRRTSDGVHRQVR